MANCLKQAAPLLLPIISTDAMLLLASYAAVNHGSHAGVAAVVACGVKFAVARAAVFGLSTLLVSGALHGREAGGVSGHLPDVNAGEDDAERPELDIARLCVVRDALARSSLGSDVDRMFFASGPLSWAEGVRAQPQAGWRGPSPPNLR